jgi:hypothetical protein
VKSKEPECGPQNSLFNDGRLPGVVMQACNLSYRKAEAGRSKFEDNLGYIANLPQKQVGMYFSSRALALQRLGFNPQ